MRWLLIVVVAAVGCGRPDYPLRVYSEITFPGGEPPWMDMASAELESRTISAANAAAREWGGNSSSLYGWMIIYTDQPLAGGTRIGETEWDEGIVRINFQAEWKCPELTSLAHEIGHVVIGDGVHADPRWWDLGFAMKIGNAMAEGVPVSDSGCLQVLRSGWTAGLPMFH